MSPSNEKNPTRLTLLIALLGAIAALVTSLLGSNGIASIIAVLQKLDKAPQTPSNPLPPKDVCNSGSVSNGGRVYCPEELIHNEIHNYPSKNKDDDYPSNSKVLVALPQSTEQPSLNFETVAPFRPMESRLKGWPTLPDWDGPTKLTPTQPQTSDLRRKYDRSVAQQEDWWNQRKSQWESRNNLEMSKAKARMKEMHSPFQYTSERNIASFPNSSLDLDTP